MVAARRLGAPPFWPDAADLAARMEAMYRAIGDHARWLALGEDASRRAGMRLIMSRNGMTPSIGVALANRP